MTKRLAREEKVITENRQMTYYFTALFMVIGIALVFFILHQKVEKINLFTILLSMFAGGIPIGFVGVYIDYKVSELRLNKRSSGQ